jgi:hypothetical protein
MEVGQHGKCSLMLIANNNNWKDRSDTNFINGFSDKELEYLCDINHYSRYKLPFLFWTTEIYGFGKCYRKWLNIPNFIPIPFYGDHGVDLSGDLALHEKNNRSRFHLTWNKFRYENKDNINFKKLIYITNPWVIYRKKNNIQPKENRNGTIIFYSHTNVGIEFENDNHDNYFNELKNLDSKFMPFVICLHMHDVQKGLHKKLRKYGFPIVTIGNSLNPNFVDRFYDMIINFKQATSNKIGSQLFYCTELGIPYFLYGETPKLINYSEKNIPLGLVTTFDPIGEKLTKLIRDTFSKHEDSVTTDQIQVTTSILGLDSKVSKQKVLFFLIIESIRLIPDYLLLLFKITKNKINK